MEYAHGVAQAHFVSGLEKTLQKLDKQSTSGGSDTSGSSAVIWFYNEQQHHAATSDWDSHAAATAALYAFTGGKGKGKGGKGGKGAKGGGKGTNRDGSAFAGDCYHCGEPGHRKFECPTANDGRPDKGKGKGKGKDKGKGKGKALDYVDADAETQSAASAATEDAGWWLGAQYSLEREMPGQPTTQPTVPPPPVPLDPRPRRPVPTSNSFLALAEVDDPAEWPPLSQPAASALCSHPCCATVAAPGAAPDPPGTPAQPSQPSEGSSQPRKDQRHSTKRKPETSPEGPRNPAAKAVETSDPKAKTVQTNAAAQLGRSPTTSAEMPSEVSSQQ